MRVRSDGEGEGWAHLYRAGQPEPEVQIEQLVGLLRWEDALLLGDERIHHAVDGDGLAVAKHEALVRLEGAREGVAEVHRTQQRLLPQVGAAKRRRSEDVQKSRNRQQPSARRYRHQALFIDKMLWAHVRGRSPNAIELWAHVVGRSPDALEHRVDRELDHLRSLVAVLEAILDHPLAMLL